MLNTALETVAVKMMRPVSRYFDEHEHEIPWDYINFMHMALRQTGAGSLAPAGEKKQDAAGKERPRIGYQPLAFMLEMLSWGDVRHVPGDPGRRTGRGCGGSRRHRRNRRRNSWHVSKARNRPSGRWR